MIVPGILFCSSFLISVCMFIVPKSLLISSATVLFTVCSAGTVEHCVLYPCCVGVFGMFAVMSNFFFSGFMGIINLTISIQYCGTHSSLEITFTFFTRQQYVFLTIR